MRVCVCSVCTYASKNSGISFLNYAPPPAKYKENIKPDHLGNYDWQSEKQLQAQKEKAKPQKLNFPSCEICKLAGIRLFNIYNGQPQGAPIVTACVFSRWFTPHLPSQGLGMV